jgi:signal peptidase
MNFVERLRDTSASRALGVLAVLLLVALVVPFVVYSVPAVVGGEESYVVLTASMTPAISPGDAVVVGDVDAADVAVGDVITFERSANDEIPVTHRVIEVVESDQGTAFRTKGDANEDADAALVTPDRVVGKVLLTIPYIGFVVQFVNSPSGFVALVVVPIALLILSEAYEFVRGRRAGEESAHAADETADGEAAGAAGAPVDDDAVPDEGATADSDEGVTLSLTTTDLTLSSVLLVAFAVYGAFVAWTLRDSLSIAVAVAVVSVTLVTLAMRFSASGAPTPGGFATDGGDALVAPTATLAAGQLDLPRVAVDSVAELSSMAGRVGRPVVRDPEGTYYLLFGDVAYTATPERTEADETAAAEPSEGDDGASDDSTAETEALTDDDSTEASG